MPDKQDFNARLSRIGATASGPKPAVRTQNLRRVSPRRDTKDQGELFYYTLAVAAVAAIVALVGLQFMSATTRDSANDLASRFVADLPAPVVAQSASVGAASDVSIYTRSMLRNLPPAPWGWVRVNTWDALYPQVKTRLHNVFTEKNALLSRNAGYIPLENFLTVFSDPANSTELQRGARVMSSAIYLNPNAQTYLEVELRPRAPARTLQNANGDWVAHLMHTDYGNFDPAQLDRVTVAGRPALLVTHPSLESQKLRKAPRNFRFRQTDHLHVVVPLSANLVMTFKGVAQLSNVEELLTDANFAGL